MENKYMSCSSLYCLVDGICQRNRIKRVEISRKCVVGHCAQSAVRHEIGKHKHSMRTVEAGRSLKFIVQRHRLRFCAMMTSSLAPDSSRHSAQDNLQRQVEAQVFHKQVYSSSVGSDASQTAPRWRPDGAHQSGRWLVLGRDGK